MEFRHGEARQRRLRCRPGDRMDRTMDGPVFEASLLSPGTQASKGHQVLMGFVRRLQQGKAPLLALSVSRLRPPFCISLSNCDLSLPNNRPD